MTAEQVADAERSDVRVEECLDAAVAYLRSLQHDDGWWKGDLATNVTMDAEDLMLRHFLGVASAQTDAETARWIRSQQREDGTWATFPGGPGDLSTTVESWSRCGWRVTIRVLRIWLGLRRSSGRRAGSSRRGCSRTSGWRCSACGRGTTVLICRPS